jgi:hypothetical protein
MMLTQGAGGLAISQMIRTHAVVTRDSPAFKLIRDCEKRLGMQGTKDKDRIPTPDNMHATNRMAILADMKTSFLRMFCEGKAAPTLEKLLPEIVAAR